MLIPLVLAALQGLSPQPADTTPELRPDSAALASAYADAATAALVREARLQRSQIDASVFRYSATIRQRISVSLRALHRDRLVFRREGATRVHWRRDGPGRVEVLGAREAVPMALPGVRVPDDLTGWALEMIPEPGGDRLVISPEGDGFAWHPLVAGGEAVYTYATGDTTEIRLPDGRAIRLIELRVTPRRADIRLVTGSFWIDADTRSIVQAVYRPSRDFDLDRDLPEIDPDEAEDAEEIPDVLKPVRLDVRYMTVEYGLWELRWWMPRLLRVEASLQLGPARFPASVEVVYSDYDVEGDRYGLPELPPVMRRLAGDPYASETRPFKHRVTVVVPDSTRLLDSEMLPATLYEGGPMITEQEMRTLADRLELLPPTPWRVTPPRFTWPWQLGRGLLRYNRVEGLSAGARVDVDLGPAAADLTARLATAALHPTATLGVSIPTLRRDWRVAAYHRLAVADPAVRALGLGGSLSALLWGRDDGSYFRATGAEVVVSPAAGGARHSLRLYGERQSDVDNATDVSGRKLFDAGWSFPPNIEADPATQLGIAARVAFEHGLDPAGLRFRLGAEATAETGDHTFLRPGATLGIGVPLPGRFLAAAELGAGTMLSAAPDTARSAPTQSLWYLGGPATVRGFAGAAATGRDHLRGRLEVGTAFPAARLAVFGDAGWAGDFRAFTADDALLAAGLGASFLDGLLRLDLAHTLHPERWWRLELYVDALF